MGAQRGAAAPARLTDARERRLRASPAPRAALLPTHPAAPRGASARVCPGARGTFQPKLRFRESTTRRRLPLPAPPARYLRGRRVGERVRTRGGAEISAAEIVRRASSCGYRAPWRASSPFQVLHLPGRHLFFLPLIPPFHLPSHLNPFPLTY